MIEIIPFVLGPVATNTYLLADKASKEAVVIDPAWPEPRIINTAEKRQWQIKQVWVTHAHFDHFSGVGQLVESLTPKPILALHPDDLPLWRLKGGAAWFGMHMSAAPQPTMMLEHGQVLHLGSIAFEVRCVPGHSPGHVIFYCAEQRVAFCGDTLFWGSIGRTDLPGGDTDQLLRCIREQILTLPEETRLLSGHGEETSVGQEKRLNPFLTGLANSFI